MVALSGFVALGTGISNTGVFQEATTYTRGTLALTGTVLSGLTQALAQITGPTGPVGGIITKGAIFDSLTGGNMLCYWDWATITAVPANFLAVTLNVTFNTYLQTALNLALLGGQGTSGSWVDAGAQIGTMNGLPLIAGMRLNIAPGGNLTPHIGTGQWIGNAEVQGLLSVNALSGSVNNNITATPGASQTGAALMSAVINRVSTVASATDSCVLPGPTIAPVGSMLVVINNAAANSLNLYPDLGAAINAGSANGAFGLAASKSALLARVSSLLWITIPFVPS